MKLRLFLLLYVCFLSSGSLAKSDTTALEKQLTELQSDLTVILAQVQQNSFALKEMERLLHSNKELFVEQYVVLSDLKKILLMSQDKALSANKNVSIDWLEAYQKAIGFFNHDDYEQAIQSFKDLLDETDIPQSYLDRIHYFLGTLYFLIDDYQKTLFYYARIDENKNNLEYYYADFLEKAFQASKRLQNVQKIEHYQHLLEQHIPKDPE